MDATHLAAALTDLRPELLRYLTRLSGSPQGAEDIVQSTYVRAHEALDRAPATFDELRRWLFRIATNLALDELRRMKRWRLNSVVELRQLAEGNAAFMAKSATLVATPEMRNVVREHLDTCFGCVVRNLPEAQAASVLLRELHGFSVAQISEMLDARTTQVKHWLQAGRRTMHDRYASTCALVTKQGVCHQCTELSDYFSAPGPADLGISKGVLKERLSALRPLNKSAVGEWHRTLMNLASDDAGENKRCGFRK